MILLVWRVITRGGPTAHISRPVTPPEVRARQLRERHSGSTTFNDSDPLKPCGATIPWRALPVGDVAIVTTHGTGPHDSLCVRLNASVNETWAPPMTGAAATAHLGHARSTTLGRRSSLHDCTEERHQRAALHHGETVVVEEVSQVDGPAVGHGGEVWVCTDAGTAAFHDSAPLQRKYGAVHTPAFFVSPSQGRVLRVVSCRLTTLPTIPNLPRPRAAGACQ